MQFILAILFFLGIVIWVIFDYRKIRREKRRCPKCGHITNNKFSWEHNGKDIFISVESNEKNYVSLYKCEICGSGWNETYEHSENTG